MAPRGSSSSVSRPRCLTRCSCKQASGGASCDAFPAPLSHRQAPCAAADDLYIGVELRNDKPPLVQVARWHCAESTCCKCMFQVFQKFQR
jgi:hypothetical protein